MSRIAVLGAGICGLVAARDLRIRGYDVVALEAGPETGGVIGSETRDGYLLEIGPNTLALRADSAALELLAETEMLEKAIERSREKQQILGWRGQQRSGVRKERHARKGSEAGLSPWAIFLKF